MCNYKRTSKLFRENNGFGKIKGKGERDGGREGGTEGEREGEMKEGRDR